MQYNNNKNNNSTNKNYEGDDNMAIMGVIPAQGNILYKYLVEKPLKQQKLHKLPLNFTE